MSRAYPILLLTLVACHHVQSFDRIENHFPTTFDRVALETSDSPSDLQPPNGHTDDPSTTESNVEYDSSTEDTISSTTQGPPIDTRTRIKLTTPDEEVQRPSRPFDYVNTFRRMKSKGVVVDDGPIRGQESRQSQSTVTSSEPSSASSKEYFYNIDRIIRSSRDFNGQESTNIPTGPWSNHRYQLPRGAQTNGQEPQMVLVFAHSVEIPLVVTPPTRQPPMPSSSRPRYVYLRRPLMGQPTRMTSPMPANPSTADSINHLFYTPLTQVHPGYHHQPFQGHHGPARRLVTSSSDVRRVRILPVSRVYYDDHEAGESHPVKMVNFYHPDNWMDHRL